MDSDWKNSDFVIKDRYLLTQQMKMIGADSLFWGISHSGKKTAMFIISRNSEKPWYADLRNVSIRAEPAD